MKGLGSSWCIVEEVGDGKCIVNTWNNQLEVPVDNLEPQKFDKNQYQAIKDLGDRIRDVTSSNFALSSNRCIFVGFTLELIEEV